MARQNEDNNDGNNSNREEKEGQFSKAGRSGTNRKFTEYSEEELRAQKAFVQGDFGKVSTAKETWEPFVRASRAGLLDEMQKCENSTEMLDCDAADDRHHDERQRGETNAGERGDVTAATDADNGADEDGQN